MKKFVYTLVGLSLWSSLCALAHEPMKFERDQLSYVETASKQSDGRQDFDLDHENDDSFSSHYVPEHLLPYLPYVAVTAAAVAAGTVYSFRKTIGPAVASCCIRVATQYPQATATMAAVSAVGLSFLPQALCTINRLFESRQGRVATCHGCGACGCGPR